LDRSIYRCIGAYKDVEEHIQTYRIIYGWIGAYTDV
jgi:hypothetical protein